MRKVFLTLMAVLLLVGIAGAAVQVSDDGTKIDVTERINFVSGPTVTKDGPEVKVSFAAPTFSGNTVVGGTLSVTGASTFTGNVIMNGLTILDVNDYDSGAGALPIDKPVIALTTGGAEALTLADGVEGQILIIKMVVDGGDGTVTPANFGDGTTLTFDNTDSATLIFLGSSWWVVGTPTATVA